MPDGRVLWLPDMLRDRGVPVVALPAWERRGRPSLHPRLHVAHHDVSPAGSDLGYLLAVVNGRSAPTVVPGPLSQTFLPRGLTPFGRAVRVVASGVANHAGRGGWRGWVGNSRAGGTEGANNGVGEPWTGWQLDMWPEIEAAWVEGIRRYEDSSVPVDAVCDHHEWTPRKIDRALIDSTVSRARVAHLVTTGHRPLLEEDDDMPRPDDIVDALQAPERGRWLLRRNGQVHPFGAVFYGEYEAELRGRDPKMFVRLVPHRSGAPGYVLIAEDGSEHPRPHGPA